MARTAVYRSFEVCEGFGPKAGPLCFECQSRAEADEALELLSMQGSSAQLYGVKANEGGAEGERVLLRILLGRKAA